MKEYYVLPGKTYLSHIESGIFIGANTNSTLHLPEERNFAQWSPKIAVPAGLKNFLSRYDNALEIAVSDGAGSVVTRTRRFVRTSAR